MIVYKEIAPGEIEEFIITGACTTDEITAMIANRYREGLKGVLWNLSDPNVSNLNADDMRTIAQVAEQHAVHKKTAHYSPHDLQFGLLRMYEGYAEMGALAPQMMAFRDRDKAIEWLKE